MGHIRWGRLLAGGAAAGVVHFLLGFVVNGLILGPAWRELLISLSRSPEASATPSAVPVFLVADLLKGLATVWLYVAIRPRFGAGPKTAALAGAAAWLMVVVLASLAVAPMGIFPLTFELTRLALEAVVFVLAALLAGWIYREEPST